MSGIRIVIPAALRQLSGAPAEFTLDVPQPVTQRTVLDALEARYPMLRGTLRDHATKQRRAFIRFYACEEDLSYGSPDDALPDAVAEGREPYLVIGAIAGG
ncbi:MAG: MoaD/ThiS family protein [Gemmatimonadota bacterium]|nr:MoaD/ThiS family protein [Gemmatimonadota bacterium]